MRLECATKWSKVRNIVLYEVAAHADTQMILTKPCSDRLTDRLMPLFLSARKIWGTFRRLGNRRFKLARRRQCDAQPTLILRQISVLHCLLVSGLPTFKLATPVRQYVIDDVSEQTRLSPQRDIVSEILEHRHGLHRSGMSGPAKAHAGEDQNNRMQPGLVRTRRKVRHKQDKDILHCCHCAMLILARMRVCRSRCLGKLSEICLEHIYDFPTGL